MTQHVNLPIHREHDCAPHQLADVRAALGRAGYSDPDTTAAELVDQLAAERDSFRHALSVAGDLIVEIRDDTKRTDQERVSAWDILGSRPSSAHDAGTLIRYCVYPGCRRSYRADVGPSDRGWMRLRGLAVLCPDHSTAAGGAQDAAPPAESHAQARVGPERDHDTTYPPAEMQAFLDYSTAEWRAARTADERVEVIRDLLEGWHDRWDAYYATAVTDEYDGIARHLVTLITAAEAAP
ncbi:hypothetical protein [Salinispora mooreana]|uniref:hypothetical protein n=1 Tax=Salinispora mooreana TaxID=999545 RepID=UPI00037CD2B8|nr:hypothetical protein [Salinispora mooreana]